MTLSYDADDRQAMLMLANMGVTKTFSREGHGFQPTATTFIFVNRTKMRNSKYFEIYKEKKS